MGTFKSFEQKSKHLKPDTCISLDSIGILFEYKNLPWTLNAFADRTDLYQSFEDLVNAGIIGNGFIPAHKFYLVNLLLKVNTIAGLKALKVREKNSSVTSERQYASQQIKDFLYAKGRKQKF